MLEHHRDRGHGGRQTFWGGLKRERELEHDLEVYRACGSAAEHLGERVNPRLIPETAEALRQLLADAGCLRLRRGARAAELMAGVIITTDDGSRVFDAARIVDRFVWRFCGTPCRKRCETTRNHTKGARQKLKTTNSFQRAPFQ